MGSCEQPVAEPGFVLDFLATTLPFSELDEHARRSLASQCVIDFAPKGVRLMTQGVTVLDSLYLIQTGGVRQFLVSESGEETLIDVSCVGAAVGALALIQGGPAAMNAETVEDTFFFRMARQAFLDAVERHPCVAQHFLKSFSEQYLDKAFDELRRRNITLACDRGLYLFGAKVGELVGREAVTIEMGKTIRNAAMRMSQEQVGSLLILDPDGQMKGIVTDTDLRTAVALGLDFEVPVETLMHAPVVTARPDEICFDALLRMMSENIHHLAVVRGKELVGVVTAHDIMLLQGRSPLSIFREIKSQNKIEGLYPLGGMIPQVISSLVEEGAKSTHITRLITILNDLILEKLLDLLIQQMGPPPAPFCWLLMGSEGRREQTFKTDQDNALVYKTFDDEIVGRAAEVYFSAFAERAVGHLVQCGFPPCPGGVMASNIQWRQPLHVWRGYFNSWIANPEPQEVVRASIFFDFRSGYGHGEFATELRDFVIRRAGQEEVFLRFLAAHSLETKPPISFFKNFMVEKDGAHKNQLDIKKRGLAPFSDFARILALKAGLAETNTLDRLEALARQDRIPSDLYGDMCDAYEFLLQLRLVHQLEQAELGQDLDNYIEPGRLSEVEKRTLKESFAVIGRMQAFIRDLFHLTI